MGLNFEDLKMQKLNIPTEQAEWVDVKNGVLCLAVMVTPRVMDVKLSKLAYFLYFLLMAAKNIIYHWYIKCLFPIWCQFGPDPDPYDYYFQNDLNIILCSAQKLIGC